MYASRLSEPTRPSVFVKSDLGMRSYDKGKIVTDQGFEPGTPVSVLTATGMLVRYDNAGNDGSEVLKGFLCDRVLPGFEGEFDVVQILARDGEVFADRVPYPVVLANDGTVDAAATAALKTALVAEALALGILFRDRH